MQVKLSIVISLLGCCILAQNPDNPTKENFAQLRNQTQYLASRVQALETSVAGQQQCTEECGSLTVEVTQLTVNIQVQIQAVLTSQTALEGKVNEHEVEINQLIGELRQLADRLSRLTARANLIAEDGSPGNKACPAGFGYSRDGFRCYKAVFEPMTWDQARSRCASEAAGAQLVTITDAGKNTAVTKLMEFYKFTDPDAYNTKCRTDFWTSGRRLNDNCDSEFFWQPSSNVLTPMKYTNWIWNEPNCALGGTEHCLHYGLEASWNLGWNDAQCSVTMCFICEHSPV